MGRLRRLGVPELAPRKEKGFFRIIAEEDDRDYDNCSNNSDEIPFLAMEDEECKEDGRRHKILLPSLRLRNKPNYSLSIDLSLPSLMDEFADRGSPTTPVAA